MRLKALLAAHQAARAAQAAQGHRGGESAAVGGAASQGPESPSLAAGEAPDLTLVGPAAAGGSGGGSDKAAVAARQVAEAAPAAAEHPFAELLASADSLGYGVDSHPKRQKQDTRGGGRGAASGRGGIYVAGGSVASGAGPEGWEEEEQEQEIGARGGGSGWGTAEEEHKDDQAQVRLRGVKWRNSCWAAVTRRTTLRAEVVLGEFGTEAEAGMAYDLDRLQQQGAKAQRLNFPLLRQHYKDILGRLRQLEATAAADATGAMAAAEAMGGAINGSSGNGGRRKRGAGQAQAPSLLLTLLDERARLAAAVAATAAVARHMPGALAAGGSTAGGPVHLPAA